MIAQDKCFFATIGSRLLMQPSSYDAPFLMNIKQTLPLRLFVLFLIFCLADATVVAQTKKIDSLILALKNEKSEKGKLPILHQLSKSFTAVDPDKKYLYAKQLLAIGEKYKIDSVVAIATLDMAMVHGIKTHYDSSMYYFTRGLAFSKEKKVYSQEARAYVGIGYSFDRLDNPKAAIENYKLALNIFKKLKHKKGLNQTYINLGSLYYDMTEYKIAETYFKQALQIAREAKNEDAIAQGYFNIGGTSFKLGNEQLAYKYYMESLRRREEMNDLNGIALANWGLGELYSQQGKYNEAQKLLDIALKNNRILKNKYQEAAVLMTISKNYLRLNDFKKAEEHALLALENAEVMKSKGIKVLCLGLLIEISGKNKNYKKAFDYQTDQIAVEDSLDLEKAKNEFIYTDFKRIRTDNEILEKDNETISSKNLRYKTAIYLVTSLLVVVLVLLFLYLIKIREKNKINKILELQAAEIKSINHQLEQVNEELRIQNEVTTAQNAELEHINSVKNMFFSIISHDLRSPIATLKMLFSTYFEGQLTREELNVLLKKLEENIFNTADFLDNLLEWSKSQLEGMVVKPELFHVARVVRGNLKILNTQIAQKNLIIKNNIDTDATAFADRNMITVVMRNLISNSIKFCNQGDSIVLDCSYSDNCILISVQDTGVGIDPADQEKIFQLEHSITEGTSGEKGHHIGLVLCKDMVEQNRGKLWFESTLGHGTTFFIEIPKDADNLEPC